MIKRGHVFGPEFRYPVLARYVEGVLSGPNFGPVLWDRFWAQFLRNLRKLCVSE